VRHLNLDQLDTLLTVIDLGSFSAAARKLNLSQPAVSQQVKELESRLGVPLIERLGKRAHATAAAADVLMRARRLLEEAQSIAAAARRHDDASVGRVRIGTATAVCVYLLPSVLGAVRLTHPRIEIAIDINCEIDPSQALGLVRMCAGYGLAFVEEPVPDNHPGRMADFRRQTGLQIAAGQSMGALYRFNELLVQQAVDILQPNVVNCGGYTGGLRVADMALGFETPICNGGGSTQHNLHLQAGAVNGTICEWHPYQSAGAVAAICPTAPKPQNGYLMLTDAPGLGFDPDPAALKEYASKE